MGRYMVRRFMYSSERIGWGQHHLLVCSFPASSPYWHQRREESW
jgi:hypothetical protein